MGNKNQSKFNQTQFNESNQNAKTNQNINDISKKNNSDALNQNLNDNMITKIASIASNYKLIQEAEQYGLNILNITWEDTGRDKNSCWGPNISDMTLQLYQNSTYLPVIRFPNFSDVTADLPIEQFNISVGNETGSEIKRIPLKEYLNSAKQYIKTTNDISLLYDEKRDKNILTCAQFCILPLENNTCEFNIHLFNYQSYQGNPGVLVLVASQGGTSAQLTIENTLYFNQNEKACNFIAERLEDERKRTGKKQGEDMSVDEQERNCLMIFQIPLKVEKPIYDSYNNYSYTNNECEEECYDENEVYPSSICIDRCRGMDNAMLKVGEAHSDFKGVENLKIERDFDFPIRCTLQFYKVTDSDNIPNTIFKEMKEKIDYVYKFGVAHGSLVVEGDTKRTTEWIGDK